MKGSMPPEGPEGKLRWEVSPGPRCWSRCLQVEKDPKHQQSILQLSSREGKSLQHRDGKRHSQRESLLRLLQRGLCLGSRKKKHCKLTRQPHFSLASEEYKGFNHHLRTKSEPLTSNKQPSRKRLKVPMSNGPFLHHPQEDPTSQV